MVVIDASVALAWVLPDEDDTFAAEVFRHVYDEGALVPAVWTLEVGNALLMAQRRKRLTAPQMTQALGLLRQVGVRISAPAMETDLGQVLILAQQHHLTTYDASYLELAARASCPLATLDVDLAKVAQGLGVFFKAP